MRISIGLDWIAIVLCVMIGVPTCIIVTCLIVTGLVSITKILTDSKKSSCKEEESDVKE